MANNTTTFSGIKAFLKLLPDTVLVVNKEGVIEDLLNYQPEISIPLDPLHQLGCKMQDLFSHTSLKGNSGEKLMNAFLNTMKTREKKIITYEIQHTNHIGYAEGYIIPFEKDYTIGIFRNVTKRVKAQLEAVEQRNRLAMVLDNSRLAVWTYSPDTDRINACNENAIFQSNMKLGEIVNYFVPEDRNKILKFIDNIVNGLREQSCKQFRMIASDNQIHWHKFYAKGIRGENGKIKQLIGTREDVTAEVEREQRFKNYIQRSELAIKAANIIQWDFHVKTHHYTRLYPDPMNPGEFIRLPFFFTIHPHDQMILKQEQERRSLENEGYSNLHLRIMLEEDSNYRWVNAFSVPMEFYPDGSLKNITGLLIDITHIEKVEEANRMKMAFLANMSHEIRTPLNAIVGFSQLMASSDDHKEKEEFMRIINDNNNLLLQIINDILDISKIDAGKMVFNYTDFDITDVIIDLQQVYKPHLSEGVELVCKLPSAKYVIRSEKNRLTQVITNLLNNAVKFTSKGTITIGYEVIPRGLAFYVSDTGKGINEENLKHVFERFAKFDSFIPGTGLGLSISQMIVTKLGGEISVESELGVGTTFRFTIACDSIKKKEPDDCSKN